jgi:iron complex transport system permease protein
VTQTAAPPIRSTRVPGAWMAAAVACLLGAIALGVLIGPASLRPGGILRAFADRLPLVDLSFGLTDREATILWELRFPRVVLAGLVGAMLAGAGAAYQGVFRNPLADPYLLGVAAGAGLGATLAIAYGPDGAAWAVDPLPLAAFAGAILGVGATYLLGSSAITARTTATLILSGVAVAAFLTAIQTFVQQRESETLQQVYSWLLGQLGTVGWREVALILPYVVVAGLAILLHRRLLDVLSVGEDEAESLGIAPRRVRLTVVVAASLGTAAAVAVTGLIGFVGIIVPHTVRLVAGASYRTVVPLSLVLGAAFLIATDLVARTALAPAELPIGVVTAALGAPFFLVVLRRSRRTT